MTRYVFFALYMKITSVGVWTILFGGPMRGTPAGMQWKFESSLLPFSSRYWTFSQNSGL